MYHFLKNLRELIITLVGKDDEVVTSGGRMFCAEASACCSERVRDTGDGPRFPAVPERGALMV